MAKIVRKYILVKYKSDEFYFLILTTEKRAQSFGAWEYARLRYCSI